MIILNINIKKILWSTVPGLIIPIPVDFYFAGAETQYHPYWHTFGVTMFGLWLLISALSSMYFWYTGIREATDIGRL